MEKGKRVEEMCVGLPQVTEQDKNETGGDGRRAVLCERR